MARGRGSAFSVGEDVAKTMASMSKALDVSTKDAFRAVGKVASTTMMRHAVEAPGADRRFSRMRGYNHGGRLGVKVVARAKSLFVGSKGPWKLAETGADPHLIGGWRHPGTRQGRQSWSRGAAIALAEAERTVPDMIDEAVGGAFRGR